MLNTYKLISPVDRIFLKKQVKYIYFKNEVVGHASHFEFVMKRLPNRIYRSYHTDVKWFFKSLIDNLRGTSIGINFRALQSKYPALRSTELIKFKKKGDNYCLKKKH